MTELVTLGKKRPPLAAVTAAAVFACVPTLEVPAEVPADSMVLAVVLSEPEERPAVRAAWLTSEPSVGVPAAVGPDEVMAILWWPKAALVDPQGSVLPDDVIARARAVVPPNEAPPGTGQCGRCVAASEQAPATIFAGDLCPPPSFASARIGDRAVTAAERAALREQVRLAWPGECPCRPTALRPEAMALQTRTLLPQEGGRASRRIAVDDRGAILSVAEDRLFPFSPGGVALEPLLDPEIFDRLETVTAIPPGPGFAGGFLVVHDRFEPDGHLYELVTIADQEARRQDAGGPAEFPAEAAVSLAGGQVLLLGEHERDLRVDRCMLTGSPPRLSCEREDPCPGTICPVRAQLAIGDTDDGHVVVGEGDGFLLREASGWRASSFSGLPGDVDDRHFYAAAAARGRFWGCLALDGSGERDAVVTATLSGEWGSLVEARVVHEYDRRDPDTATTCESLWSDPTRGVVWMESSGWRSGHRWVRLGRDAVMTASAAISDRSLYAIARSPAGWLALSARDGSVFRSAPSTAAGTQLSGPPHVVWGAPALAPDADGFLVLSEDNALQRLSWGDLGPAGAISDVRVTPLGIELPDEAGVLSQHLGPDVSAGTVLRFVHTASIAIDRVDLVTGQVRRLLARRAPSKGDLHVIAPWPDLHLLLFAGLAESSLWSWKVDASDLRPVEGPGPVSGMALGHGAAIAWTNDPKGQRDRLWRLRRTGDQLLFDELPFDSVAREADPAPGYRRIAHLRAVCPDALQVVTEFNDESVLLGWCENGGCANGTPGRTGPEIVTIIPRDQFRRGLVVAGPPEDPVAIDAGGPVTSARQRLGSVPFFGPFGDAASRQDAWFLTAPSGWLVVGLLK